MKFGLVALVAGCHAPLGQTVAPLQAPAGPAVAMSEQGRVAVTIQWPYRAQVIPTSSERLRFTLSGPSARTILVDRPAGPAPVSTASLQVDIGTGYALSIEALSREHESDMEPAVVVASGQSEPFDVLANKVTSVRVALTSSFLPTITGFSPTNGGPGTYVTITGSHFGAARSLALGILFGSAAAAVVVRSDEGTASALVPDGATTSAIVPVVDGVTGVASGSFTVLSALGIQSDGSPIASGDTRVFTAVATTTEGTAFLTPTVQWALSTDSCGILDPAGAFTATGTGSAEIRITSGQLVATASVTVP